MRCLLFCLACYCCSMLTAQGRYQAGDFIFQDLDCGPLCEAIEAVTPGRNGKHFSHVGLVTLEEDSIFVFEAISRGGVVKTPLSNFLSRTGETGDNVHLRLRAEYRALIPRALAFCETQLGTPYDDVYLLANGRYYCSELLNEAFSVAADTSNFFPWLPMTFKSPGRDEFNPAWVDYYQALGQAIPEGELGCNPGGMAADARLQPVDQ